MAERMPRKIPSDVFLIAPDDHPDWGGLSGEEQDLRHQQWLAECDVLEKKSFRLDLLRSQALFHASLTKGVQNPEPYPHADELAQLEAEVLARYMSAPQSEKDFILETSKMIEESLSNLKADLRKKAARRTASNGAVAEQVPERTPQEQVEALKGYAGVLGASEWADPILDDALRKLPDPKMTESD